MLPKKNRADKKAIEKTFQEGRFVNSPNLTFKFKVFKTNNAPRISFIAPKSIAKLAVRRNLLRRLGYEALSKQIGYFPNGILGVFIFKKYQDNKIIIENEIKNTINKIN